MKTALVLLAAFAAAAPAAAAPAHRAAAHRAVQRDWTHFVVATPQGGFRMGNPAARVKLVEYGSLTCPHCRMFNVTGVKALEQRYVRTGKVSYEFRSFILNGPDIAVSLLARCAGAAGFFPMSDAVYAAQPQWVAKLTGLSAAQKAELQSMSDAQRMIRIAQVAGLGQLAARFGVSPARARQCLSNPAGARRLAEMAEAAGKAGVGSTPTFFVNGRHVEAETWETLEPLLKAGG